MAKGRRPNRKGRNKGLFVALPHSLLDKPAFRTLSSAGKTVLIAVARAYNGRNNGQIAFGERAGQDWGLSRQTTRRALQECAAAGLIAMTREGTFTSKRLVREWSISWQPVMPGLPEAGEIPRAKFGHDRVKNQPCKPGDDENASVAGSKIDPVKPSIAAA